MKLTKLDDLGLCCEVEPTQAAKEARAAVKDLLAVYLKTCGALRAAEKAVNDLAPLIEEIGRKIGQTRVLIECQTKEEEE